MNKRDIKMLCLGWLIGTPLTVLVAGLLFFLVFQRRATGHGSLPPCTWTIRIEDQNGQPVPGVELAIQEGWTGRPWGHIGNWSGPGSIYTDETGEATFSVQHTTPSLSINRLYLWGGYVKDTSRWPKIVMLYKGHDIFTMPLGVGWGTESVTVVVVRDLSRLPSWVIEE